MKTALIFGSTGLIGGILLKLLASDQKYKKKFLIGKRKEERLGEKIGIFTMKCISPILVGDLKKYKSINAEIVAKSMINISNSEIQSGVFEPPQLLEIGKE